MQETRLHQTLVSKDTRHYCWWLHYLTYGIVGSDLGDLDLYTVPLLRIGDEDDITLNPRQTVSTPTDLRDGNIEFITDFHRLRLKESLWKPPAWVALRLL